MGWLDSTRWPIPWVARVAAKGRTRTLKQVLSKRRESLPNEFVDVDWIYANDEEAGFFRVDYGDARH